MKEFIVQTFGGNIVTQYLACFIVSMVPLLELRGAIPIAQVFKVLNPEFNMVLAYCIIAIGNMLPVPVIFFFARKVLEWGKDKKVIGGFFTFCLEKGRKGGLKLQEKAGRSVYIALLLFVGIPMPGTGAWVGTLAASLLDMDFKKSVLAVVGGVALAGVIMGVGSYLVASGILAAG